MGSCDLSSELIPANGTLWEMILARLKDALEICLRQGLGELTASELMPRMSEAPTVEGEGPSPLCPT